MARRAPEALDEATVLARQAVRLEAELRAAVGGALVALTRELRSLLADAPASERRRVLGVAQRRLLADSEFAEGRELAAMTRELRQVTESLAAVAEPDGSTSDAIFQRRAARRGEGTGRGSASSERRS